MGVRVEFVEGEPLRDALARFLRAVEHASVRYELQWHAEYQKPGSVRRALKGLAKRRAQRAAAARRAELWVDK